MPTRKTAKAPLPDLWKFADESTRAKLIRLRTAVEPILANNILHHFTDHSVTHSDSVCRLVDYLIERLQDGEEQLSDDELIVLYAACYSHDLGMQYENAAETAVIRGLRLTSAWEKLDESARRDYLRRYHHLISAELVQSSVQSGKPPIGLQLTTDYRPALIARLCEAHCVTPTTDRYAELVQEVPEIRMPLITGLLRLADILDESGHRACREKARTLLLSVESQSHRWRHYYTHNVVVDNGSKTITIWFAFPTDHVDEYQRIIPQLQLPWIEQELDYHRQAFNSVGLGWTLRHRHEGGPYTNVEQMPDAVMAEMLKQLHRQQMKDEELSRQTVLHSFKEARPVMERRLAELKDSKDALEIDEYISRLASVAFDLWELGSRRSAWMTLAGEFERSYVTLKSERRVEIGTRLLRMLSEDDSPESARAWLGHFEADLLGLEPGNGLKLPGLRALAEWYLHMCAYEEAVAAFQQAMAAAVTKTVVEELSAELLEMHFLQGEFEKCVDAPIT